MERKWAKLKCWILYLFFFIFFSSLVDLLAQWNQASHLETTLCGYCGGVPAWGSPWFAITLYRSEEKTEGWSSRVISYSWFFYCFWFFQRSFYYCWVPYFLYLPLPGIQKPMSFWHILLSYLNGDFEFFVSQTIFDVSHDS